MVSVDAALDWADTGMAYLTGEPDGQPDFSRAAVLAEARRVAADIARLLGVEVDAATTLAGRAAIMGLTRGAESRRAAQPGCWPPLTAGVQSHCRATTMSRRCRH